MFMLSSLMSCHAISLFSFLFVSSSYQYLYLMFMLPQLLFMYLLCKYLYCDVVFILICLLPTNLFGLLNSQKITKKRKFVTNVTCCLLLYFGTSQSIFVFMFLASMFRCKLLVFIQMSMQALNDMIRNDPSLLIRGLRKRNSVEIAARSSIFPAFQTKVNLKAIASR